MDLQPTPTHNTVPFRPADFRTLAEALDYAARGVTGCDFYSGRGELYAALPYARLRAEARALARRLVGLGLERGARIVLIAETSPDFLRFFFACQYAGLVPVPVPVPVSLGSHTAYVDLLRGMLKSSEAAVAHAPNGYLPLLDEAAADLGLTFIGDAARFHALPESELELQPSRSDELAYLQYTSGSTRFPRGVMIDQETVLSNLQGIIKHGVRFGPGDRCVSWLPFYHDMGLVGLVLVPLTAQASVDYLGTRDFAMRPRQWLKLLSQTKGTVSFSPPFGYELCARRLRPGEAADLDLKAWRVAGVGAEMIHPDVLERFAEAVKPSGFDPNAFLPCYGMAECSLAVTFSALDGGIAVDRVDTDLLETQGVAAPVTDAPEEAGRINTFVDCGKLLPDFEMQIRDEQGRVLPERHTGTIFLKGPSIMSGYFKEPEVSREMLSEDGWLDTGDIGYRVGNSLFITGRRKDLIIINGRNIWPQDLEYLAQRQPEIRSGDCLAFSAPGPEEHELAVMVVQCRETDAAKRAELVHRLRGLVDTEFGIDCHVELVPLHTLPRTSSGKLSRSKARQNFIDAHRWDGETSAVTTGFSRDSGRLSVA